MAPRDFQNLPICFKRPALICTPAHCLSPGLCHKASLLYSFTNLMDDRWWASDLLALFIFPLWKVLSVVILPYWDRGTWKYFSLSPTWCFYEEKFWVFMCNHPVLSAVAREPLSLIYSVATNACILLKNSFSLFWYFETVSLGGPSWPDNHDVA